MKKVEAKKKVGLSFKFLHRKVVKKSAYSKDMYVEENGDAF